MVASSASERQKCGAYLSDFGTFKVRMKALGFGHLEVLHTPTRIGFAFVGHGTLYDDDVLKREREVFEALFPGKEYEWSDFAKAAQHDPEDRNGKLHRNWKNKFLDAQAFYVHDASRRDVFITSDSNFSKRLTGSLAFPNAKVLKPSEAIDGLGMISGQ